MDSSLVEFYRHNLWANMLLLDTCEKLTEEQLGLTGPGTYGPVRDTLTHLVGAELRYVSRLRNQGPDLTVSEKDGYPGMEALRAGARKSGEALIEIAGQVQPGTILKGVWRGEPYKLPEYIVLLQAINHATEHRMHIVGILNQHGISTPDLDGWAYDDALKKG